MNAREALLRARKVFPVTPYSEAHILKSHRKKWARAVLSLGESWVCALSTKNVDMSVGGSRKQKPFCEPDPYEKVVEGPLLHAITLPAYILEKFK